MLPVLTVFVLATLAAAEPGPVKSRQAPTELLPAQIAAFHPYSQFSRAAGCSPDKTQNWTCGVPCDALPGFQPTTHGGDGNAEQFWYVGYHPPLKSVIVAHQGTNASEMLPILTDLHIRLESLNKTLFINTPDGVRVHRGFREEHERTADRILAAVKSTLETHPDASVTCTGHSLGAAISQLDAVFLRSQLPSATSVKYVGYGCPRVGNRDYADYVDASLGYFTRINNKKDPVPILPPRFLTYRHPSGEIHIDAENRWLSCPGQDSNAVGCINEIGTIFNSTPSDHVGIVDGVPFSSCN